ncbi:hypothetical protein FKM82_026857 [Ascaphus truei]
MRLSLLLRGFEFGQREIAHWFPGHMSRGLKQMKARLQSVDCILEVHDARISFVSILMWLLCFFNTPNLPLSGRNPMFKESLGIRPHLLILNKMDLADQTQQKRVLAKLELQGVKNVIYTNCVKDENIKQVVPAITELIGSSQRFQRAESPDSCIMVIGVPNVGKSSLINSLRRLHLKKGGKASKVGGEPGMTRSVLSRIQVCDVNITVPNYSAAAYDFIRAFRRGVLGKVTLD